MSSQRPNIVLLTIDALRADHLSCHGYRRDTSPNFDRLTETGAWFRQTFSASSHTGEAVPPILTGKYPDEAIDDRYKLVATTIAERLEQRGFATGGFHSNPYLSRAFGYGSEFDEFYDDLYLGNHKSLALIQRALDIFRDRHYARADEINERSLMWLDSLSQEPFFLWNHYMDVHGPYEPPDEYRQYFRDSSVEARNLHRLYKRAVSDPESITDQEHQSLVDLYDGEIRYLDAKLGTFIEELKQRNLFENSLVIVTADHGDGFGENGYYGHPRYLDDELVSVPLLISGAIEAKRTIDIPTTTLDIVPTVLAALGMEEAELPGEPLQSLLQHPGNYQDRIIFSQVKGDEDNNNEHLRRFSVRSREETHHITRDRRTNEIVREPEQGGTSLVRELTNHSRNRVADHGNADGNGQKDEEMEDEIERRLEALGYK